MPVEIVMSEDNMREMKKGFAICSISEIQITQRQPSGNCGENNSSKIWPDHVQHKVLLWCHQWVKYNAGL